MSKLSTWEQTMEDKNIGAQSSSVSWSAHLARYGSHAEQQHQLHQ